jgi:hypothetical protein
MTLQNLRIQNPSVTLYAFQLRTEMATGVVADAAHLWEKLAQLSHYFSIPELQQLPEKLICYQNGNYHPDGELGQRTHYLELIQPKPAELQFSPVTQDELTLSGSVYPLRLHDTYAVDFTVSFQHQEVAINQLRHFNPQNCLIPSHIQASIGQTLLLYAEPLKLKNALEAKIFADECVKALLQVAEPPPLSNQGILFGSPIFEYEAIPKFDAPHPNELTHILVWLGNPAKTLKLVKETKFSFDLINLLNCRNKVLYAYHQASQSNDSARQFYTELEAKTQQLDQLPKAQEERLKLLECVLNNTSFDILKYARYLRNLADHRTTILTNTTNYAKWLKYIREISLPTDDLTFLDDFHKNTREHHQQQISIYLDYLKPGHQLFEQLTTTILGLVHIEEQKQQMIRARKFEFLITFIGAAVGTGAISATVIPEPPNLVELVSQFFDFAQLPLFETPQWLNHFALPENLLKVMFHIIIGGMTALVFAPLISFISRVFTPK